MSSYLLPAPFIPPQRKAAAPAADTSVRPAAFVLPGVFQHTAQVGKASKHWKRMVAGKGKQTKDLTRRPEWNARFHRAHINDYAKAKEMSMFRDNIPIPKYASAWTLVKELDSPVVPIRNTKSHTDLFDKRAMNGKMYKVDRKKHDGKPDTKYTPPWKVLGYLEREPVIDVHAMRIEQRKRRARSRMEEKRRNKKPAYNKAQSVPFLSTSSSGMLAPLKNQHTHAVGVHAHEVYVAAVKVPMRKLYDASKTHPCMLDLDGYCTYPLINGSASGE